MRAPGMGGGMGGPPGGGFGGRMGGGMPGGYRGMRGPGGRNLTEGPITSTLIMFSLPMLGGNVLQQLNVTANQFWVAHLLGATDITAIGNANSIMMLMMGAIFGATMAANILIAQQVGAGDLALVKRIMGTAVFFFFVLSVTLSLTGGIFAPHILAAMRTPPAARDQAIIYLRVVFAAMPFMYFFQFLQMAQRGAGDSRTPFYFMGLAVVLDMLFNPLLIAGVNGAIGGWGWFPRIPVPLHFAGIGVAGSAASTLIGQSVALLLLLVVLYRRNSVLMLKGRDLRLLIPSWEILRPLVLRGIPMSLQMFIMSAAGMIMISFVNGFGAVTSAAYVGGLQVWNYIQMPGMAVGASVSSMAGQNVGAGQWHRVERIAIIGLVLSVCVTGSIAVVIYALGPLPLYIFLPANSPMIPIALHMDRTVLWAFVIFNATFALSGIVRSTGAVWPPLIILVVSMLVIRVPFAYFMIPHFGPDAIWWSFPLGTLTSSGLTALYYRYGGWRKVRMLHHFPGAEPEDVPQALPATDAIEREGSMSGEILAS
ncbi:MAG TPA: MATE family efflux transporter [Caulobacteraceae bacterium]|nr:MATE family efflux transporter [Caulobacteraceae bacterium]